MNGLNGRSRIGLILAGAVVAVGSLAWVAMAQEVAGAGKKSDVAAGFAAAQAKLGDLQKSIGAAVDKLKVTGGSASEREKVVDEFIARLKDMDASLNATGDLGRLVDQTIKINQEKQSEYEKNSSDPNLIPEIRASYDKLKERFKANVAGLVDKKLLLDKQDGNLKESIKLFSQQKKLLGDLILVDATEEANALVGAVILKAIDLNDELRKMAREIGQTGTVPSGRSDVQPSR